MPRVAGPTILVVFAVVLLVAFAGGTAEGSALPRGLCVVCGETFHENVTATDATLEVRENGDVHWRVENEVEESTLRRWRQEPDSVETRVSDALTDQSRPPHDPTRPDVSVEGETLVIEFVDRNAARERFGVLVVPYFHSEGSRTRYAVNANDFVLQAPEGQRILNEPAGATVTADRAVWSGIPNPETDGWTTVTRDSVLPSNTYVVVGAGPFAGVGTTLALWFVPLDAGLYLFYGFGLLVGIGMAATGFVTTSRDFHRGWLLAVAVAIGIPYAVHVGSIHPIPSSATLPGYVLRVSTVGRAILLGLVGALVFVLAGWYTGD